MGRLETPTKPSGSSQDPAYSAKIAAAKALQATIADRHAAGNRKLTDSEIVKNAIDTFDESELRHLLHRIVDDNPKALATVKTYCAPATCKTPLGAAGKP